MKQQIILLLAMVFFIAFTGSVSADLTDGLVAYYPFSGNANDVTGNGHDGTVYDASLTTDRFGNPNSAYSFDGVNDYISLNNPGDLISSSSFSVSLWAFVAENTNTYDPLIWFGPVNAYPDFTISRDRSGNENGPFYSQAYGIQDYWVRSLAEGDDVIGSWFHLVATIDGVNQTLTLYVDGVFQDVAPIVGFGSIPTPAANIGRDTWTSGVDYHYGLIDDVRIYNRALSASEVYDLYVVPIPGAVILGSIGITFAGWRLRKNKEL